MPTQLKAIHASRVGKSGLLYWKKSQSISNEPSALENTGERLLLPGV